LLVAAGAFEGEDLGLKLPGLDAAATRANEAVWPAGFNEIIGAGAFIGEALLELQE